MAIFSSYFPPGILSSQLVTLDPNKIANASNFWLIAKPAADGVIKGKDAAAINDEEA